MIKKEMTVFLVLFFVGFACANSADITFMGEIGTFSGAVMKLESPVSGDKGDKIFPSENLHSVGILKFEAETPLSEVYLNFMITKDGSVVNEVRRGPFEMNGSDILVDLRERVELEVLKEAPKEEVNLSLVVGNETENNTVENVSVEEAPEEVGSSSFADFLKDFVITGKAVFLDEDGSVDVGALGGSFAFFLFFGIFIFMMFKKGRRDMPHMGDGKVAATKEEDSELEELEELEERVKATEGKISKIKKAEEVKKKKAELKEKLKREEEELKGLERAESTEEVEKVEDAQ